MRSAFLFGLWVLLSGKLDRLHLGIGLACALLIAALSLTLDPPNTTYKKFRQVPGILLRGTAYALWLLGRITLAAFHVSQVVLRRRMPIRPEMIRHRTFLKSDLEKVIFAQSITLTPGTITADIEGDLLTVHRLDEASSGDIETGIMEAQIRKIFHPSRGKSG